MGLYVPKLLLLLFNRSLTNGACSFLPSRTSHSSKRACPTACTETTTRTSHLPCLPNPFVPMAASETLFSKPSTWNCESHHDACASNALRFRCKLSNSDKKRAARPQDKGFQLEMDRPSGFHVLRWFLYSGCFNLASGADQLRFLCYVYIYIYKYMCVLLRNHSMLPHIMFTLSPCSSTCGKKTSSFIHGSWEEVENFAPQLATRRTRRKLPTCGTNILPPQAAVSCNSVPHSIQVAVHLQTIG